MKFVKPKPGLYDYKIVNKFFYGIVALNSSNSNVYRFIELGYFLWVAVWALVLLIFVYGEFIADFGLAITFYDRIFKSFLYV